VLRTGFRPLQFELFEFLVLHHINSCPFRHVKWSCFFPSAHIVQRLQNVTA
jgi:hypothetical protein